MPIDRNDLPPTNDGAASSNECAQVNPLAFVGVSKSVFIRKAIELAADMCAQIDANLDGCASPAYIVAEWHRAMDELIEELEQFRDAVAERAGDLDFVQQKMREAGPSVDVEN